MPNTFTRSFPAVLVILCAALLCRAEPDKQETDKQVPDAKAAPKAADEPAEKQYEIKIARSVPVGTKYALTADGALLRQVTLHVAGRDQKQPDDGFGIHLE